MDLKESLIDWIKKISSVSFGPACPYAYTAWLKDEVFLAENNTAIEELIPLKNDIAVCVLPMLDIGYKDLKEMCKKYNEKYDDYIFLDTHPEETLRLRGLKTVWEYPAILIQWKKELKETRNHLMSKGFYDNWDEDLLISLGVK